MLRIGFVGLLVLLGAQAGSAQQWAEKMFAERAHDFGSVPRAAKVEYEFTLKNLYRDDVHISSVRSSCGCTEPRILKDTLKSHEEGAILAHFNTDSFSGHRSARVTVTIDRPQYAEVQLDVKGHIRTDVVLSPGEVAFGSVPEGQASEKKVNIEYAGRGSWKVTGATTDSPYLTASIQEVARAGGRTSYELNVQLAGDAPVGYLNDEVLLTTNDQRSTQFPVKVEGLIVAQLSVSPTILMLGTLNPGQKVNKQFVVKGAKPFKIVDVQCDNRGFRFQTSAESKTVHLVPFTFEAGSDNGKVSGKIQIVTDLENNKSIELPITGQISTPLAGN